MASRREGDAGPDHSLLIATAPLAVAIAVFGVIFGGLARPLAGPWIILGSSAIIFSGAVQFSVAGLLLADATVPATLAVAATLNLRNLLLGAVLRPRLEVGPLRRAALAWFLVDESFGLTVASERRPARTLLTSGIVCYAAWLTGTAVGVLGGSVLALQSAAQAVFPVLFIGLAAMSARSLGMAGRALLAAALTVVGVLVWPEGRGLVPVMTSVAVSLPGR